MKVLDGRYSLEQAPGTFSLIAVTSADEVGIVPPFACLIRSATDDDGGDVLLLAQVRLRASP